MKTVLFEASYYYTLKGFMVFWLLREKQRQDTNRLRGASCVSEALPSLLCSASGCWHKNKFHCKLCVIYMRSSLIL